MNKLLARVCSIISRRESYLSRINKKHINTYIRRNPMHYLNCCVNRNSVYTKKKGKTTTIFIGPSAGLGHR